MQTYTGLVFAFITYRVWRRLKDKGTNEVVDASDAQVSSTEHTLSHRIPICSLARSLTFGPATVLVFARWMASAVMNAGAGAAQALL